MGFIHGIKNKLSRKSAENLFPYILAWTAVWTICMCAKTKRHLQRQHLKQCAEAELSAKIQGRVLTHILSCR